MYFTHKALTIDTTNNSNNNNNDNNNSDNNHDNYNPDDNTKDNTDDNVAGTGEGKGFDWSEYSMLVDRDCSNRKENLHSSFLLLLSTTLFGTK